MPNSIIIIWVGYNPADNTPVTNTWDTMRQGKEGFDLMSLRVSEPISIRHQQVIPYIFNHISRIPTGTEINRGRE